MSFIDKNALNEKLGQIPGYKSPLDGDIMISLRDIQRIINTIPTADNVEPVVDGIWIYYTNDEGKARWRCSNCGRVCKRDPNDKKRCSSCGAHMKKEA